MKPRPTSTSSIWSHSCFLFQNLKAPIKEELHIGAYDGLIRHQNVYPRHGEGPQRRHQPWHDLEAAKTYKFEACFG